MVDKFIPLAVPVIGEEERANLMRCVDTQYVSTVGEFVEQFEADVAQISGTYVTPKQPGDCLGAVAVAAGTMGLHIALVSLGVGCGDLVIAPSFTFIASANAISHTGAKPWLMDIDPASWSLDPEVVRKALEGETERRGGHLIHRATNRRIAAMLPVYTLGTPADLDALRSLGLEFGIPIVADAAAAIGALYKGRPIAHFADLTVYSFNGNKTITTGGGGAIVSNNLQALRKIRHLVSTARVGKDYDHDAIGYNYRMTNLEAAVGCAQIKKLGGFIEAKTRIRRAYDAAFADLPHVSPFPDPDWGTSAYWFSGLVLHEGAGITARAAVDYLNSKDMEIGARVFWKPIHLQLPYADAPRTDMDVSEKTWERIVTLPCSTNLSDMDLNRVVTAVRTVLEEAAVKGC